MQKSKTTCRFDRFISSIAAFAAISVIASGCAAGPSNSKPPQSEMAQQTPATGPRRNFTFKTLDGSILSDEKLAGRITVIGFLTAYDDASQVQVRFLSNLLHRHSPRLNVAVVMLDPPENRPLVEVFAKTLRIDYPVALADPETIAGRGPFPGLHHVPSVVILDRRGYEVWRHIGLVEGKALEQAVQAIERGFAPPSQNAPAPQPAE